MEIWLNNGDDKIRFPILPSSFEVATSQQNTSETVHRKGEVNLLGEKMLKTIEISSFFSRHRNTIFASIKDLIRILIFM